MTRQADEYFPGSEALPEDIEPLTASDETFPSIFGEEMYTPGDDGLTIDNEDIDVGSLDSDMLAYGLATSKALHMQLSGGLFNSDFSIGPPTPGEPIGDNNPLPGWKFGDEGAPGGLRLYWVDDATAPGGKSIRGHADVGEVDEKFVYIEQVVPVAPRMRVLAPTGLWSYASGQELLGYVECQFYDYLGAMLANVAGDTDSVIAEQGFGDESTYASGGAQLHQTPDEVALVIGAVPEGARFMLVRYMWFVETIDTISVATAQATDLKEAFAGEPTLFYASASFYQENLPGTVGYNADWLMGSHGSSGSFTTGSIEGFIAPSTGWVHSIAARINTARTAGQTSIQSRSSTTAYAIGPYVDIDGNNNGYTDDLVYSRGIPYFESTSNRETNAGSGELWNIFAGGERIFVRSRSTGSNTWAPTSADGVAQVTFALVDERGASNPNH